MANKTRILLIYTGGTIGMIKDPETGTLKSFNFENLIDRIPELRLLDCIIESVSFENPIDSSEMNPEYWIKIAEIIEDNYNSYDGFVVLHGSDTMSYTSSAISFMLENLNKPVVFTGSQLPIGDLRTDAKENLITSIQIASLKENNEPVIKEVCLYFEYKLYRANRTTKINAAQFEAFASLNYPELMQSGVHLEINHKYLLRPNSTKQLKVHKELCIDIALIKLYPGISKELLNSLFLTPGIKGVILETYGAGNTTTKPWFLDIIQNAINQGIHVINVTQCSGGSVTLGHYESSNQLKNIGIISGKDITTEAALAKLMYMLGIKITQQEFKPYFETAIRGEIT